ncbi:nuclear pore complex protein Nup160 homolog isoform X2 [Sitophilus oryzae]|uniref:Nuclear pore complex protein Nup160 homolog isoform X2 n=1 Tax=Sitophilus oryzae TaxID=7048 RepID=A0A6J2YVW4_SITOR|nr:nuclear pore complex protein Nup160 homolog isoform X2 [Sitophilus oryzae]
MSEFTLSYREVTPDQALYEKWIEITLHTGGTQSTLQDIKITERANGYSYLDSTRHYTRNRFIYWRISSDTLELIEQSLDINLTGNTVRYRFMDSPIIDGISVQETEENVIILVPTVCSVHMLRFPHPSNYHKQDDLLGSHPNLAAPSIFSKASTLEARNPNNFYVFNNPSTAMDQLPNLASSFYDTENGEAIFILSYPSLELLLIKLNGHGQTICTELKGESLMPRFLSGLTEKFRAKNNDAGQIVSTLIQLIDYEVYILTLTRGGHLKFWSSKNGQCVAVIDILTETGDFGRDRLQHAVLKKALDAQENDCPLAIFMSFPSGCQFHILKPIVSGQQIRIKRLNTLTSLESNLIDFSLQCDRLWSLWRTSEDDCVIHTASLKSGTWTPIIREVVNDIQNPVNRGECDPRQVYLQHLFHPGRFPLHVINKSLGIYKKSSYITSEINLTSVAAMKQAISLAIESDIQSCFSDSEVMDHEYLEYTEWCWQKFYSCCLQYHQTSLRPLGLMVIPQSSGAVLLKKATFSFLRPTEPLEHMILCSDYMYKDQFINFALLAEESDLIDDVMTLFEVLVYLDKQLNNRFKTEFEQKLAINLSPNTVITNLLENLKIEVDGEYNNICQRVTVLLNQCSDLYRAIHKVLELLRQDSTPANPDNDVNPSALHFFSSSLGVSFVAASLRQQCQNRFAICRDLLIICNILFDTKQLQPNVYEAIHSVCKPEIIYLTQANYVMLWMTKLPALNNVPQENSIQRLAPIKLTPAYNIKPNGAIFSLLELFSSSTGGHEARKMLAKIDYNGESMAHWHLSLLPFISYLRQILWPLKNSTMLAEWLVSSGQHVWLQQYVKMLSSWCDWNISSCSFLLAVSFLMSAENYKALDLFQIAAKGIFTEPFMQERMLKGDKGPQAYINYYLKVIHLFELHKARDCAIQMANTALSIVETDNPLLATLYSIKFKHHLALKHYEEAFYALKSNPDHERKKDNLRDLVKTLLDEKKFDVLLSFTYGDMDELFTSILLTRARATDATSNVFYDFLYAYQITRGPLCHRLAASIMYEQAYRLSQTNTTDALEKQVKCYLAAKNVLQLVDPQYAWVIRPSDPDEDEDEVILESLAGSQKDNEVFRIKKQIEVVDIEIIKKELIFSCAKLKLARFDSSIPSNVNTPVELVTLLNSAGLFKTALEICTTYNLGYATVFESLTLKCIMLSEEENPNAWDWLVENDLQDLPANRDSISEVVWQLLQDYLEKYEEPNMTTLHKIVCKKIINMRMYIPFWMLKSYKVRNPSEILRLLHCSGRLEEAFEVAHEYLLAALGYGKELYGFKVPLAPNSPAFCLPVYEIQCFIKELQMQNDKDLLRPFQKEHTILKELFEKYLATATRISNEKCQLQMSSFGSIGSVANRSIF